MSAMVTNGLTGGVHILRGCSFSNRGAVPAGIVSSYPRRCPVPGMKDVSTRKIRIEPKKFTSEQTKEVMTQQNVPKRL